MGGWPGKDWVMGEVGEQFPQNLKNTDLSLRAKCWVRGGVGGEFPRILHVC